MLLQKGKSYKILGWCNAIYIGREESFGTVRHMFDRTDGFGVYCVKNDQLDQEVQEWELDADKLVARIQHLGIVLDEKAHDPGI